MFLTSCLMWLLGEPHAHPFSQGYLSDSRVETWDLQQKGFMALSTPLPQRAAKPKMYFLKGQAVSTTGLPLPKLQQAEDNVCNHM